ACDRVAVGDPAPKRAVGSGLPAACTPCLRHLGRFADRIRVDGAKRLTRCKRTPDVKRGAETWLDKDIIRTAIATGIGRPARGRWSCAFPSCAAAATSPASLSPGVWPRRL